MIYRRQNAQKRRSSFAPFPGALPTRILQVPPTPVRLCFVVLTSRRMNTSTREGGGGRGATKTNKPSHNTHNKKETRQKKGSNVEIIRYVTRRYQTLQKKKERERDRCIFCFLIDSSIYKYLSLRDALDTKQKTPKQKK